MIWNSPLNKARQINQDKTIYGTFAEIGAGQEVARFFFLAGQASQTIAKTMSAYDMLFSDEIYGKEPSGRYVCQSRVQRMLEKEFLLLNRRLEKTKGQDTRFFVFADTVATNANKTKPSHGWMGVRFQLQPGQDYSQVTLHIKLLDTHRLQQQETLGILGVNLIHACYSKTQNPTEFLESLVDSIKKGQISIDNINVEGPAFKNYNSILLNYYLVRNEWSPAMLINSKKESVEIGDYIFQKPILIQRGHFNPVTKTHIDIINRSLSYFKNEFQKDPIILFEITTQLLTPNHPNDSITKEEEQSLLHRIHMITDLGYPVLISRFFKFYQLKEYLRALTNQPLSLIIPANHLNKIFSSEHYQDLSGGLLEGLGKLLDSMTRFYVYPHKTDKTCQTASLFLPPAPDSLIYQYFSTQKWISDLAGCDDIDHYIRSEEARLAIQSNQPQWENLLPDPTVNYIKTQGPLF